METTVTTELLFAYFDGRATPLQKQLIRDWLTEPASQERYFAGWAVWEQRQPQLETNPEQAFGQFRVRVLNAPDAQPTARSATPRRPVHWRPWLMAASVTALLIVTGWLTRPLWNTRVIATDFGEIRSVELPDGSRVTLNANSALTLPRFGFGQHTRHVTLRGEAEFSIVHTVTHQPFVVRTADEVDVVVLGTEFVVNTRRGTRVLLNRGRVQLRYGLPGNSLSDAVQTLTMHPGEWASVRAGKLLTKGQTSTPAPISNDWKQYQYQFQQTSLVKIAQLIEDNFGLRVVVSSQLRQRAVTGNFHARTADELLAALSELFTIQIHKQGRVVTLQPATDSINLPSKP